MKKLLILGAGGHAKVALDAALSMKQWDKIEFLDDAYPQKTEILPGFAIIGKCLDLEKFFNQGFEVVVAIGDIQTRLDFLDRCVQLDFPIATIIHKSAVVSPFAKIGQGSKIFANAIVNPCAAIGRGSVINTKASVDHDCVVGDGVHVAPGVTLAGNVKVGARTYIGMGSTVREGIVIGKNVMVGMGSVVVKDIPDQTTVMGSPSKII